jgi:hypothetical protein
LKKVFFGWRHASRPRNRFLRKPKKRAIIRALMKIDATTPGTANQQRKQYLHAGRQANLSWWSEDLFRMANEGVALGIVRYALPRSAK